MIAPLPQALNITLDQGVDSSDQPQLLDGDSHLSPQIASLPLHSSHPLPDRLRFFNTLAHPFFPSFYQHFIFFELTRLEGGGQSVVLDQYLLLGKILSKVVKLL